MKKAFAILAFLFASLPAMATVGSAVVNATASYTTNVGDTVTLVAQVTQCGQQTAVVPTYQNSPISNTPNQTNAAPFTAVNTGSAQSLTFTVPGNDQISCGTQNYSLYAITWFDNGFPLGPTSLYRFLDASTQSLASLVPISFTPPVLNNAAGALCPAATPVFSGFSSTYQIQCSTIATAGLTPAIPVTGGTFTGPVIFTDGLTTTSASPVNLYFINSVPQADQFAGTDACQKIYNAAQYALAHSYSMVDATHFSGIQTCTSGVNPFAFWSGGLVSEYNPVGLTIKFGNVALVSTVPFEIANGAVTIEGNGPAQTVFVYTGSGGAAAMEVHAQSSGVTNGLEQVHLRNFFVLNAGTSPQDSLLVRDVNRSSIEDVAAWGGGSSYDGMDFQGNVTTSCIRCKVSQREYANLASIPGLTVTTSPGEGIVLNSSSASGNQCTDSTFVDFAAEYVTQGSGIGVYLESANSMTFTSGTSEANKAGIAVSNTSHYNTFISTDEEGNSVYDVQEGGISDMWFGTIATNVSFATTAENDTWYNGQVQIGNFVNNSGQAAGNTIYNSGVQITPQIFGLNYTSTPANMPFNGTSHLWGGIAGMNANGNGELDIFSAFNNPTYDACFYRNVTSGNYTVDVCLGSTNVFNGAATFTGTVTLPMTATNAGTTSYTSGTGVTSLTCAPVGFSTCTNKRGRVLISNASATTSEALGTVVFSGALGSAPLCRITQDGGTAWYGLYVSASSTLAITITNNNTVSGVTQLFFDYDCQL
jgi:hypothetical protein